MSVKAIREYDGKAMLAKWMAQHSEFVLDAGVAINPATILASLPHKFPWLLSDKLVAKPDQLIKRRGKSGLIKLNASWDEAMNWIAERRDREVQVESVTGVLNHFVIERFRPHPSTDEFYVCIQSKRTGDEILFTHEGGVDVGDVDAKALRLFVPIDKQYQRLEQQQILDTLLIHVPESKRAILAKFISLLYQFFVELHFSYLEINPIVVTDALEVYPLDMAAKIDETARFECGTQWGRVDFPPPFGRPPRPEEAHIAELDARTGASLKLTILNPRGRIWTMVAGGGASVIYADTICDMGGQSELANYGEYSGAPDEASTFEYARTLLDLMTREKDPRGKVLLIGGGIANFTNVAATFKGIIRALRQFHTKLIEHNVKIFVRRAGPNYQEGLEMMRELGKQLELDIVVRGPESHMTSIVPLALGLEEPTVDSVDLPATDAKSLLTRSSSSVGSPSSQPRAWPAVSAPTETTASSSSSAAAASSPDAPVDLTPATPAPPQLPPYELFSSTTRAFVYGMQTQAVQSMLDFDFLCGRDTPSVAAIVYPFEANHFVKFYWSTKEILIPSYQSLATAAQKCPDVDVVVNFSSFRSVYESTMEIFDFPQIRTIAIIAEGVPERRTRTLINEAKKRNVNIIGPATVGGIKPGCFRIGNTGGMLDNIVASKLYRPGSVAYIARSGGMSNEMNNIIARNADGVYEGIAIGGDRYPGTTFIDHLLRYEANPEIKMLVVLGEVGGVEEYEICKLIAEKKITKPMVAWCIGTCSKMFSYEVQFGHAGACATGQLETADAKNHALLQHGVHVPKSFQEFGIMIRRVFLQLVEQGTIIVKPEPSPPVIPVDYEWARKLGLIRKPTSFVSSIVDERGDELIYAGLKISDIFKQDLGIGGVVGLIWFRRLLPAYCRKFIEMVLQLTADHGPAVSGAHNTIVCARAGKDLISSLVSGLLTIGPRFGGALDDAARRFSQAYDNGLSPEEFVNQMRKQKELIPGIGHRVKSLENPDSRVVLVKEFVKQNFKSHELFDFALEVEQITTKKKSNLILNVDGVVAVAFVDLFRGCGAFSPEEANEYISMGILNGLFVLGRSIGFIGHWIDQNRLKQGLYRHPTDDISYVVGVDL